MSENDSKQTESTPREAIMTRCNTDPATADRRVYVGNLPTDATRLELEMHFEKFGAVTAISIFRGYGFIQFMKASEAAEALRHGADKMMQGRMLVMREALVGGVRERGRGPMPERPGERDRGPDRDRPDWRDYPDEDRKRRRPEWPGDRPPRHRYDDDDRYDDRFDDGYEPGYRRGPPPRGLPPPPSRSAFDDLPPRAPPPSGYLTRPRPAAIEHERANDCEIVVLDRKNRMYAEEVEDRLKNIGLAVDMLFPRSGAPINVVLDQIVSRGTLYAVVIHPTNEQHRSVSLNIMHGNPPQEHRNMPIEDAMSLVSRNFEAYMISNKDKAPPQGIINLLDFVRENRPLTAMEYSRLIKYLEEKRDHQLKPEKTSLGLTSSLTSSIAPRPVPAPVASVPAAAAAPTQQQLDLQQKILSMMQAYKTQSHTLAAASAPVSVTVPVPAPVLAPAGMTQQQPQQQQPGSMSNVNRALDSLITSGPNLLKVDQGGQQPQAQQQQQQQGWYAAAPAGSLGQAPANPLFGAYANQHY